MLDTINSSVFIILRHFRVVNHLSKLSQYKIFSLLPFFFAEHCQSTLFVGRIDLVLFSNTNCFHATMPLEKR